MRYETTDVLVQANDAFWRDTGFLLAPSLMALVRTGSHAYGTSTPESDTDYTAIVLPPAKYILGLRKFEHWEPGVQENLDIKAMSIAKFVSLALRGNPNVVEMLFFSDDCFLRRDANFDLLTRYRQKFLSREVYKRFSGYARGQFHKMESGKYENDMGAKRKEWVDKIGYDPKDGSHLIRLLFAGYGLATTGTLSPRLENQDRSIVVSIKQGEWKLDALKSYAFYLEQSSEEAFHSPNCPLPEKPDTDFVEDLLIGMHRTVAKAA
jgi:hypothetical protein